MRAVVCVFERGELVEGRVGVFTRQKWVCNGQKRVCNHYS
jgi:hypothetical protein